MDSLMRWFAAMAIAAVIAPGGTGWLAGKQAHVFHGITTESPQAAEFTLTAHNGARVNPLEQHEKRTFVEQADAPVCHDCGSLMVRNGSCYKCLNCGTTSGCS